MFKGLIFNGFSDKNTTAERSSGAYRIAHYLRQQGWDIEVVDHFVRWPFEKLKELLKSRKDLKFIGFSATWTVNSPQLEILCAYIKKEYPEIKIIIGGNNILYSTAEADYYVTGYGETAVKAILDYEFSNGKKPYGQPFKRGWSIDALHFYPAYPYENYHIDYEARDFLEPRDILTIELSRGCRFACKFCSFPILGVKEDNSVSEEYIYNTINDYYNKWGIKNLLIADETINDRVEKLTKLSNAVSRSSFQPNFNGFIRIDLLRAHPEMIDLMIGSRLWGHYYGIETFNQTSGKIIGKGLDPNMVKELALNVRSRMMSSIGLYRGSMSFISGLPYETMDQLRETQKWLLDNWTDQSYSMYVLTIPRPDGANKPSQFTFDYKKYGYTEMDPEEVSRELKQLEMDEGTNIVSFDRHEIFWKNPQGTYFDFMRIANDLVGWETLKCKITNYTVWARMSLGISLEEAMAELWGVNGNNTIEDRMYAIVNDYADKKLSL